VARPQIGERGDRSHGGLASLTVPCRNNTGVGQGQFPAVALGLVMKFLLRSLHGPDRAYLRPMPSETTYDHPDR
jgi:hypothetical protein